jgi:hypothetical protein
VGSEEGESVVPFLREEGSSGQRARRWRRRRWPVGLLEEEDGRVAERKGPPISGGKAAGRAGPEGGGREVGCNWVGRGRKTGGSRLG